MTNILRGLAGKRSNCNFAQFVRERNCKTVAYCKDAIFVQCGSFFNGVSPVEAQWWEKNMDCQYNAVTYIYSVTLRLTLKHTSASCIGWSATIPSPHPGENSMF